MILEHRGFLELAADAEVGDPRLVQLGQIDPAVEVDLARVGLGLAGDDVHHCRLAGAVRADDRPQLAGFDVEAEVVERLEAVEADRDAVEVEDGVVPLRAGMGVRHSAGSPAPDGQAAGVDVAPARRSSKPTTPFGRNSVTTMNIPPSANSHSSGIAPVNQVFR